MWLSEPWLGVGVYLGSQGLARISLRGWVRSEGGSWILRPLQSRVEAQLSSAAGLYDVVFPLVEEHQSPQHAVDLCSLGCKALRS